MKRSLGLLEVSGLALAIGAADAMAKAASVTLVSMEKTNGSGWMLIRLTGDVAAVQVAIASGAAFASQRHGLVAQAVLARPALGLPSPWPPLSAQQAAASNADPAAIPVLNQAGTAPAALTQATCNLCRDPQCSRYKGEPRDRCLHSVTGGAS